MSKIQTESRAAFRELLDTLGEVDRRWASDEWNLMGEADVAGAHRALMHLIEGGIATFFEADPARPRFQRIVSPTRKFTGDNADAIYFDAAVSPEHTYVVRGRMDGAVYVSITVECDTGDGSMSSRTAGVINDYTLRRRSRRPLRDPPGRSRAGTQLARARSCRDPHHHAALLRERGSGGGRSGPQCGARDRAGSILGRPRCRPTTHRSRAPSAGCRASSAAAPSSSRRWSSRRRRPSCRWCRTSSP